MRISHVHLILSGSSVHAVMHVKPKSYYVNHTVVYI